MDTPNQLSSFQPFDRPKPSNIEAEVAVLGSMLLSPEAASIAFSELKLENVFYRPAHQLLFDAMLELSGGKSDAAMDTVVLADHLERAGHLEDVGGREYITQLMDSVPTAAHIEHYIKIVKHTAILRRLIGTCSSTIMKCYDTDDDVDTLLDGIEQEFFAISNATHEKDVKSMATVTNEAINYLDLMLRGDSSVMGLKTGFEFDQMITGLRPGDLFVLAARPSVGKTALALNMATNIALGPQQVPIVFFSLEMSALQLVLRIICSITRISMSDFRGHRVSQAQWVDVMRAVESLKNSKVFIDDTGAIDILELRAKARRLKNKENIGAIFIDYLQLITTHSKNNNGSREQDVARISGSLKAMAKELNVPVVVLAQLNRAAEQNEKPKLSNLRESGAIEQDADIVAILHRDKKQQNDAKRDEDKPLPAELIIAKNRNGAIGTKELCFFDRYTRFENAANVSEEQG